MADFPESHGEFTFLPQEKVLFGRGTLTRLADEVDRIGGQRAFVITGTSIATQTGFLNRIRQILGKKLVGAFHPVPQHVPRGAVLEAASSARAAKADILISLGGGSPVDGTKAVALCLSEGLSSKDQFDSYRLRSSGGVRTQPQFRGKPLPHIALTTTLSAAEFTGDFGITHESRRVKEIYGGPPFVPRIAILDPDLTIATPPWLWAATGMRAVDHAIERLYSPRHQPLVDALCLQALRYLFQNLPSSSRDPQNLESRLYCQLGSWMSILGGGSVHTGISHAIGHQLGGRCNVPHGQTSCIVLPEAMRFNMPAAAGRLAMVAEATGIDVGGLRENEAARAVIERVSGLIRELGCPTSLRDVGIEESDLPLIAEAVMEEVPWIENPRPIEGVDEILEILKRTW